MTQLHSNKWLNNDWNSHGFIISRFLMFKLLKAAKILICISNSDDYNCIVIKYI